MSSTAVSSLCLCCGSWEKQGYSHCCCETTFFCLLLIAYGQPQLESNSLSKAPQMRQKGRLENWKSQERGMRLPSFFHKSKTMSHSPIQDKFILEIQRENEILIVGVHGCWLTVLRIPQLWNSFCLASGSVSVWEVWREPLHCTRRLLSVQTETHSWLWRRWVWPSHLEISLTASANCLRKGVAALLSGYICRVTSPQIMSLQLLSY